MRNQEPTEAKLASDKINELTEQLRQIRIAEATIAKELNRIILQHNLITKEKAKHNTGKITDSRGEVIEIGDVVRFESKGKYHSTQGKVIRFTKAFVIAVDNNKNEIRRKSKNLLVLSKKVPVQIKHE